MRAATTALVVGLLLILHTSLAQAAKLIAVLPLDVENTGGKVDRAAKASLEEMLRDVTTNVLRPAGWTILSRENMLQVLQDNGVDPSACGEVSCHLQAAREIKVDKFISGSIQYVEGSLTASIRLIDTRTGQILSSGNFTGTTTLQLRQEFQKKAATFFSEADVVGSATVQEETTGELFLRVDPPDATVRIDDGEALDLIPGRNAVFTLPLGAHRLVLRKQGFQEHRQEVFLERGRPTTVMVTLLAPPPVTASSEKGYLTVDSSPREARVFLDGRDTGKLTPATFSGLAVGEHQVVLQRDLYLDWQRRITLKSNDVTLVKPTLTPNFGTLSIVSDPPGATVYIDGRQQPDSTPLTMNQYEARAYRVRLSLPQHDQVERTVVVQPGETTQLRESLKPQFGTLVLRTKPDGATVYLDDVQLPERTPTQRERLGARTYRLRLTAPAHANLDRVVTIEAGKTTVVEEALRPVTGKLVVTSAVDREPFAGAEVWVSGVRKGVTPLTLEQVSEGSVTIEVRAPLHRSWIDKFVLVAGQERQVRALLVAEYGVLTVRASPGASFTVDEQSQGPADGHATQIGTGSHRITILATDSAHYRPYSSEVVIERGAIRSIDVTLDQRLGHLVVQSSPPGATLMLDGRARGETPRRVESLLVGDHQLKLELDKYEPWSQTVTVTEEQTAAVDAVLKSVDLIRYEAEMRGRKRTRAVIAGLSGLGLVVGSGIALLSAHGYADDRSRALQRYNAAYDTAELSAARADVLSAQSSARTSQIISGVLIGLSAAAFGWMGYELVTMPASTTVTQ